MHRAQHHRPSPGLRSQRHDRVGDHRPLPSVISRRRAVGCALFTATLLDGCMRHATLTECGALLDRYVELLVREQDPKADESTIDKQRGATRQKAAHDASFA